jgi:hypothetical protein
LSAEDFYHYLRNLDVGGVAREGRIVDKYFTRRFHERSRSGRAIDHVDPSFAPTGARRTRFAKRVTSTSHEPFRAIAGLTSLSAR